MSTRLPSLPHFMSLNSSRIYHNLRYLGKANVISGLGSPYLAILACASTYGLPRLRTGLLASLVDVIHRHHNCQANNFENDCATVALRARLMERAERKPFDCNGLKHPG